MKTIIRLITIAVLGIVSAAAQNLTPTQKEADFRYLASLFSTYYAPLAWKAQAVGFDASDLRPWLDRVSRTQTDLDFYEVCVEYVASLKDTHVAFSLPSDFVASLGFGVDVYDGALLIDSLNRTRLPQRQYPFAIGDELVSIDGETGIAAVDRLMKYVPQSSVRASRRLAAQRLTSRPQSRMPHATELGDSATVVIRRQNGDLETYTVPWVKTGTPLEVGPIPAMKASIRGAVAETDPLEEVRHSGVNEDGVNGYGSRTPPFVAGLPSTFTRRLGGGNADFFYSGVFTWGDMRIGYIRIPNFSPPSQTLALLQFNAEITYMNANTDGLVIDEMHNNGGNLCFAEALASRLTPYEFRATGFDLRPYWGRILGFYDAMISAKANDYPADTIAQYELIYNEMLSANREGRLVTKSLPLCSSSLMHAPLRDNDGNVFAYQKPVMVLIDEFSTSSADSFASMMQDSGRAFIYGMRSNGAGGNNISVAAGNYSEAVVGMTLALQTRKDFVVSEDYPVSYYIENVGVRPHIVNDYMTKENLLGNGAKFINDFLEAMAEHIRQQRGTPTQ